VLEKNAPRIVDAELTRHFELDMEAIRERKKNEAEVLGEAKTVLTELIDDFKLHEKDIGEGLSAHFAETKENMTRVGKCPNCESGYLVLRKGKFGRFIACDRYPNCNTTFSLPAAGLVEVTNLICEHCKHPVVRIIRKGKRPQEVCINQQCPSKALTAEFHEHPCPKCGEGTVVLRRSIYGAFGACNRFPKCRYLERIGAPRYPKKAAAATPAVPGATSATESAVAAAAKKPAKRKAKPKKAKTI
jgi:DNA topoisomerase-1